MFAGDGDTCEEAHNADRQDDQGICHYGGEQAEAVKGDQKKNAGEQEQLNEDGSCPGFAASFTAGGCVPAAGGAEDLAFPLGVGIGLV